MRRLTALAAVLAAGCVPQVVTVGRDFNPGDARRLQYGSATLSDARALFGEPTSCATLGNGKTACTWSHTVARPYGLTAEASTKTLSLYFDESGRLTRDLQ